MYQTCRWPATYCSLQFTLCLSLRSEVLRNSIWLVRDHTGNFPEFLYNFERVLNDAGEKLRKFVKGGHSSGGARSLTSHAHSKRKRMYFRRLTACVTPETSFSATCKSTVQTSVMRTPKVVVLRPYHT